MYIWLPRNYPCLYSAGGSPEVWIRRYWVCMQWSQQVAGKGFPDYSFYFDNLLSGYRTDMLYLAIVQKQRTFIDL